MKAGRSITDATMRKTSFINQNYEHTVLPSVSNIEPNSGLVGGQKIKITGTGLSNY